MLRLLRRIRWVWVWAAITAIYRNREELMRWFDRAMRAIRGRGRGGAGNKQLPG